MVAKIQPVEQKPRRKRQSRFMAADAEGVAVLVAQKRLTEPEACNLLGISHDSFRRWKSRGKNVARLASLIERIRAAKIDQLISSIDHAGDEITISTPKGTITRPGDWRAKAWIAERVLAPERFGQQQAAATSNNSVTVIALGGEEAIRRRVEQYCSEVDRLLPRPADALALPADQDHAQDQDQDQAVDVDPSPPPSAL